MFLRPIALAALSLGVAGFAADALAADLIEAPPAYVEPAPIPAASGWYLRGDVGYNFKSTSSGDYKFYNQFVGSEGVDDIFDDRVETDGTFDVGVGAGYRFSDHLRADFTVDYFKPDATTTSSCASYITASLGLDFYNDCENRSTSDITAWTAMANAYVDIAKFGPVTPYVGAGLGLAYVKYGDVRAEEVCGSDPACIGRDNYVGNHEGESSVRFASSLMAGASIDLTEQLKLDAGYRYMRISAGDAYGYDAADRAFGASGVQARDDGFDVHTVRAGLRYEFGAGGFGFGQDPAYAPAPGAGGPYAEQEPFYK